MNKLCDFCKHQTIDWCGGVKCGIAYYESNEFGTHKRGAFCVYDADLENRFEPISIDDTSTEELSKVIYRQNTIISELRHELSILKERLVKIYE